MSGKLATLSVIVKAFVHSRSRMYLQIDVLNRVRCTICEWSL